MLSIEIIGKIIITIAIYYGYLHSQQLRVLLRVVGHAVAKEKNTFLLGWHKKKKTLCTGSNKPENIANNIAEKANSALPLRSHFFLSLANSN